jgi:hypothetical protein
MADPLDPFGLGSFSGAAGAPPLSVFLQALLDLVRATNAQAQIIKSQAPAGASSGDLSGLYPGPITVVGTHLTAPLSIGQGGTGNTSGQPSGAASGDLSASYPGPIVVSTHLGAPLPVVQGGTGLSSGTSGGVLAWTAIGVIGSSVLLTQNALMLGGGAGAAPGVMPSLGTTTTVLHGNAAGAPTFGAVSLTADVTGTLPVANGGTGAATLTAHGVLLGEGVGAVVATAVMTNGQLLVGQTGADPLPKTVSGDATMALTGAVTVTGVGGNSVTPGVWTPALNFGGAAVGITYGTQSGTFIQIGKLVIAHFNIILTSKGVSVGAATLAGLPATCGALDGAVAVSSHAAMATSNVFECAVSNGTTSMFLGKGNAVASAALADTDFTNTTTIRGVATYISV